MPGNGTNNKKTKTGYHSMIVSLIVSVFLFAGNPVSGQTFTEDTIRANKMLDNSIDTFSIDPPRSLALAQNAVDYSKKINYQYGIAWGQMVMGKLYNKMGNPGKATEQLNEALKTSRAYKLRKIESKVNNELGRLSQFQSDYKGALSYFSEALNICKEIKDSVAMAKTYVFIGSCYAHQDNFDEAIKNYESAIEIHRTLKMPGDLAELYHNISALYFNHNEFPIGLGYLYKSINLSKELNNVNALCVPYSQLATYYQTIKQFDSAIYYYNESLKITGKTGNKQMEIEVVNSMGGLYFDMGQYNSAEKYYKKAYLLAQAANYKEILYRVSYDRSHTFAKMNAYKEAFAYMDTAYGLRDSVLDDEKAKAIGEMQVRFDVKELDEKNKLLKQENDIERIKLQRKNILIYSGFGAAILFLIIGVLIVRQNRFKAGQQRMELEQKQLLAQINPHFIFNCLNSIQQFIIQNDTMNANKYLADFALLMRQTLDNSKDGTISVRRELEYLGNYLSFEHMRFEDKFSYTIECAEDINADTTEIPSMIIQPFVENAIRHGLCNLEHRKGILSIRFYKKENALYCEVDDNGIGMEEAKKLRELTFIKYQSLGLELTNKRLALVSKLNSEDYKITIIDKKKQHRDSSGTTIIIKFPLHL